ncbi:hypothetical protein DUNSADRAFT_6901, partial [Dunaliella salina]
VHLVLEQPALLATQMPSIIEALDSLEEGLRPPDGRMGALEILCKQPALVYDTTVASLKDRLDSLAAVFQVPVADMLQEEQGRGVSVVSLAVIQGDHSTSALCSCLRTCLQGMAGKWGLDGPPCRNLR